MQNPVPNRKETWIERQLKIFYYYRWIVCDGNKTAEEHIAGKGNLIFESISATYFFFLKGRAGNIYNMNKTY